MKLPIVIAAFFLSYVLSGCGVKRPPTGVIKIPEPPNLDCSIYDPECAVQDPKYDPRCDPTIPARPAICDLWNEKYEQQRIAWRKQQEQKKLIEEMKEEAPKSQELSIAPGETATGVSPLDVTP